MFNTLLQKQRSSGLNWFFPVVWKLYCSDSAVVNREPKLKALAEEDFSRVLKKEFQGHFIENLFLNKLQEKVLEYPQIDTIEEVEVIKRHQDLAQKLITGRNDNESTSFEVDSKTAVLTLKRHELIGFKVPRLKQGFGYLNSEYTFMQEVLGLDPSLCKTVCEQEDFGIFLIDKFGSDFQKGQYLLKLTNGENIASFANTEKNNLLPVPNSFSTNAVISSDNKSYTISGTKCWVYNADCADLFILTANVVPDGGQESKPTLFLVDKNMPGVEVHEPIKTVGLKNLSICDVTFNNVVVPISSVLGEVSQADKLIKNALSQGKLNNGGYCLAAMRKLLNAAIQHCIHNEFFNKDKHETDYFRIKVANMACQMYSVESMTYLLTGRLDTHVNADAFLESLIVKIYASETLQFFIKEVLEILGHEFFFSDDNFIELSRDSQFYVACDYANDHLRLILSSSGLNYAINYIKKRGFAQWFSDVFNKQEFGKLMFFVQDKLFYKDVAQGYLHRMFYHESLLFEDCVAKLHFSTMFLINKYRDKVFDRKLELGYLADMVMNVYAMAATLGRASRAYCINVKLQEIDRICTELEIRRCFLRVQKMHSLIQEPKKLQQCSEIASDILKSNKYSDIYPVIKNLTIQ